MDSQPHHPCCSMTTWCATNCSSLPAGRTGQQSRCWPRPAARSGFIFTHINLGSLAPPPRHLIPSWTNATRGPWSPDKNFFFFGSSKVDARDTVVIQVVPGQQIPILGMMIWLIVCKNRTVLSHQDYELCILAVVMSSLRQTLLTRGKSDYKWLNHFIYGSDWKTGLLFFFLWNLSLFVLYMQISRNCSVSPCWSSSLLKDLKLKKRKRRKQHWIASIYNWQ